MSEMPVVLKISTLSLYWDVDGYLTKIGICVNFWTTQTDAKFLSSTFTAYSTRNVHNQLHI